MKKIIFMFLLILVSLNAEESQQNKLEKAAEDNTIGLGLIYIYKDTIKAKFLFERSCEADYMLGCQNLGKVYFELKEYRKAENVFNKTCQANLPEGCYMFGKLYLGYLENSNLTKSLKFFKKSCKLEYADGCFGAGILYYKGASNKIKINYKIAKEFFNKSCSFGNDNGCKYEKKCK